MVYVYKRILKFHEEHKQEERERVERGRRDARPTALPITEIAIKLEPVKL